jgi:hypothetical protein
VEVRKPVEIMYCFLYFFTLTDNFKKGDGAKEKNEFKFDTSG